METPKTLEDLDQPDAHREQFLRLRDARVVLVDYPLVFADFPWLAKGRSADDARRAAVRWLLDNAAVVSKSQALQTVTNTEIRVRNDGFVQGIRPPSHGRSAVLKALRSPHQPNDHDLLSVKGVGVSNSRVPAREPQPDQGAQAAPRFRRRSS